MEGKSQPQVPFTGVPTTPSVDPELVDSREGMADVRDYPRREDAEVQGPLGVIVLLTVGHATVTSFLYRLLFCPFHQFWSLLSRLCFVFSIRCHSAISHLF